MKYASQSGSAILWVMIAVILLAALTSAIMRSTRTSASFITDEQATIYANQIIAYGNEVKGAVKRILLRGYEDTQIDLSNSVYLYDSGAALIPANANCNEDACRVYTMAGGGILPKVMPEASLLPYIDDTTSKAGHGGVNQTIFVNVGTSAPDLVFSMHELKREVCLKINTILGVNNPGGEPPLDMTGAGSLFSGTYNTTGQFGDEDPALAGKSEACFLKGTGAGARYQYIIVLIAR